MSVPVDCARRPSIFRGEKNPPNKSHRHRRFDIDLELLPTRTFTSAARSLDNDVSNVKNPLKYLTPRAFKKKPPPSSSRIITIKLLYSALSFGEIQSSSLCGATAASPIRFPAIPPRQRAGSRIGDRISRFSNFGAFLFPRKHRLLVSRRKIPAITSIHLARSSFPRNLVRSPERRDSRSRRSLSPSLYTVLHDDEEGAGGDSPVEAVPEARAADKSFERKRVAGRSLPFLFSARLPYGRFDLYVGVDYN